ncbi:zinc finger FYVE domain-containing protein 16 isoform X2 [Brienomyrus brachyistius]|uniref:zinc finger FYVE domain-containing protein 16 isoform X2 n=1 Tax=Brienomyrus brachyistius TaxID=42636 RepID=UPI0020B29633|nr:zinc finger FYVE domain-containing protein 16 isoform X2 [Brienomyrus brachyistius]
MDTFFKAAVCDLDKLLDDFEQNTDSAALHDVKSQSYSSPLRDCGPPSCDSYPRDSEVTGRPLTDVDLLSSVDNRTTKSIAPPCPDRALKPVCDLVSDTASASLLRANSHDAFKELDVAENQLEELLVDFESPVIYLPGNASPVGIRRTHGEESPDNGALLESDSHDHLVVGELPSSVSLLDIILPASSEGAGEPQSVVSPGSSGVQESVKNECEVSVESAENIAEDDEFPCPAEREDVVGAVCGSGENDGEGLVTNNIGHSHESPVPSDGKCDHPEGGSRTTGWSNSLCSQTPSSPRQESSLSCLPMAVSMCGSLVSSLDSREHEETRIEKEPEVVLSNSQVQSDPDIPQVTLPVDGTINHTNPDADSSEVVEESTADSLSKVTSFHHMIKTHECSGTSVAPLSPNGCQDSGSLMQESLSPSACEGPRKPPDYAFMESFLSENDQGALLVTDEELDAFLMGQKDTTPVGPEMEKSADGRILEANGYGADPYSFSQDGFEEEEHGNIRSHQDSGTYKDSNQMLPSVEESKDSSPSSQSQDSSPCSPDLGNRSSSEELISDVGQANFTANQHPYFGGARPKQLYSQPPRIASTCETEDHGRGEVKDLHNSGEMLVNTTHSSPAAVPVAEDPSQCITNSSYPFQESYENSVDYDELSDPPPYSKDAPGLTADHQHLMKEADGLGVRQPPWIPDSEAPNCMHCQQKFTFTKRRHHCRACGKVYCAVCCNRKCKLKYLEKEARVCVICYDIIQRGFPREQRRVWFADGILPNGEVADTTRLSTGTRKTSQESSPVTLEPAVPGSQPVKPTHSLGESPEAAGVPVAEGALGGAVVGLAEADCPPVSGSWDYSLLCRVGDLVAKSSSLVPEDEEGLPPLLIITGEGADVMVEERPAASQILLLLEEGGPQPLTFVLNANLLVNIKIVTYTGKKCWCFGSNGLQAVGQKEVVFVLQCLPEETNLPRDIFNLYVSIYQDAEKGKFVEDLGNVTFTESFLGSRDHGGFLFFSPTFQPLEDLLLPHDLYLCGVLIQKLEVPWVKVFPLRLLLRLGAEHSVYPSPLVSVRFRKAVFREVGHTIMNLLADLRNYQYSLPMVDGLKIHMEMGNSYIDIPKCKLSEMLKVVNTSNEHVISLGASFSPEADSHLVCVQNEGGVYETQASSKPGKTRKVTGASFVVFNGALKASSGFIAKSSIVEDGLMVQIPPETMEALRQAVRDQSDFQISCGKVEVADLRENVTLRWVDWVAPPVKGSTSSPVDGRSLDAVPSVRLQQDTEFETDGKIVRCVEAFILVKGVQAPLSAPLPSQFLREISAASCKALSPRLAVLTGSGINRFGLRISTDGDMVEYQAGSGSRLLPQRYMNELDGALIPVIHGGSSGVPQQPMDVEFIFYITERLR